MVVKLPQICPVPRISFLKEDWKTTTFTFKVCGSMRQSQKMSTSDLDRSWNEVFVHIHVFQSTTEMQINFFSLLRSQYANEMKTNV